MIDDKAFRKLFDEELVPTNLSGAYAVLGAHRDHSLGQPASEARRPEMRLIVPVLEVVLDRPRSRINPQCRAQRCPLDAAAVSSRGQWTSTEWSGVTQSGTWTEVRGNWTIPTVSEPSTPAGSDGIWWMYSWVGLDGAGSNELLQVGVDQRVHPDGSTVCYAWYEWLAPDSPTNPPYVSYTRIANLAVNPGDEVFGYAGYRQHAGKNVAGTVELSNHTTGLGVTIPLQSPPLAPMAGATVEWIVENPGGGYPTVALAKFAPVTFTGCYGGTPTGSAGVIGYPSEGDIWNLTDTTGTTLTKVQVASAGSNDPNETVSYSQ